MNRAVPQAASQRGQPGHVGFQPDVVGPQVHLAQAEKMHREQHAAGNQERIFDVQRLAQADPLHQAVEQQEQAEAGQHALDHLFVERAAVKRRRLAERDRQDHRAQGLDPHQQVVFAARLEYQRHRMRAAADRPLGKRLHVAEHGMALRPPAGDHMHVDAVEQRVIEIQHPVAVRLRRYRYRQAQPDDFLAQSERGVRRLRRLEAGQRGDGTVDAVQPVGVVQDADRRPGVNSRGAVVELERVACGRGMCRHADGKPHRAQQVSAKGNQAG